MQGVALATALRGETAAQVIQGMRKKIYPNGNDSTNKKQPLDQNLSVA